MIRREIDSAQGIDQGATYRSMLAGVGHRKYRTEGRNEGSDLRDLRDIAG